MTSLSITTHNNKLTHASLLEIISKEPNTIREAVALEALEYDGDISAFFNELLRNGCISGMINSLIYYVDTHAFFHRYYGEIKKMCSEYKYLAGEPIKPTGDARNYLAWFAFEDTAYKIAQELGLEI